MKELLTSKKFIVMVCGLILAIAAKYGLNLDPDMIYQIVFIIAAYLGGQGLADFGKAAAQIKSDAPIKPEQVNIQNVTTEQTETKKETFK